MANEVNLLCLRTYLHKNTLFAAKNWSASSLPFFSYFHQIRSDKTLGTAKPKHLRCAQGNLLRFIPGSTNP